MGGYTTPDLPPRLYKYLPAEGALALLRTRQFWYRSPLHPDINDPWDCRADLLENLDVQESRRAYRNELVSFLCGPPPPPPFAPVGLIYHQLRASQPWTPAKVDEEFGDLFAASFSNLAQDRIRIRANLEQALKEVRILCLADNSTSPEMWHGYAEKGRGVCIGFRYVPEIDNALGAARPVRYVQQWPVIATPVEWARHLLFIEEIPFGARAVDGLFVKMEQWKHEREWRVLHKKRPITTADTEGVYRITLEPSEVVEVILGSEISLVHEAKLKHLVRTAYPHASVIGSEMRV